jgi:hypothetical protein
MKTLLHRVASLHRIALLATGVLVLQPGVVMAQAAATAYTSKASAPSTRAKVGRATPLSVSVSSKSKGANEIVSVEVYNAKGTKLAQRVWTGQNFVKGKPNTYKWSWKPAAKGTYIVKVGVFAPQWKRLINWNDRALVLTVS